MSKQTREGSVISQPEISILSHRKQVKKWQRSQRFKAMREKHARQPGIVCAHCGKEHGEQRYDRKGNPKIKNNGKPDLTVMTINHLYEYLYLTEDLYLTWDPVTMEPCCTVCNGWYRKGMEVCPVCKVNPVRFGEPMCAACFLDRNPEIKKQIEERNEAREVKIKIIKKEQSEKRRKQKAGHPCKWFRVGGKCGISSMESRCQYAKTKALSMCEKAISKKGGK